jgi:hypothetical protein
MQRCVISPDGAMISLIHKQWVEIRTVAIGEPQEKLNAAGEVEIHVGKLSYFSRLADASTFTNLAEVEMQRRKVAEAKEVSAVMDGADWCHTFTERHRPDAVRILDFPHAAEHISKLLEALTQTGMRFPPQMFDRCLHILKHRGPRPLLRVADRLGSDLVQQKGVQEHLDYLRKREALMQYPQFHSSGCAASTSLPLCLQSLPFRFSFFSSPICCISGGISSGPFACGNTPRFQSAFHWAQTPSGTPSCEVFPSRIK